MEYLKGLLTIILVSAGLYFWIVLYHHWRAWKGEPLTDNFIKYSRRAFFTYVVVLFMFIGVSYLAEPQPTTAQLSTKPTEKKLSAWEKAKVQLEAEKSFTAECRLKNNKKFCDVLNEKVSDCISTGGNKKAKYEELIAECQTKAMLQ
jgi:hypothetical protein